MTRLVWFLISCDNPFLTNLTGLAQDRTEAFLLEMHIVGQYIGDAFPPHGLHGDAIGQTFMNCAWDARRDNGRVR